MGLKERINAVSWMEDQSKQVAIEKINTLIEKIGYPSWMSDSDYIDQLYNNVIPNS